MKMRTVMEYGGKSLPVMGCSFTASIHPPAPEIGTKVYAAEYAAWKKKLNESPEMLIKIQIAFPMYYWRAQYYQQGNRPLYIVDFPAIGNVVQLKDCVFQNNIDLRLPNGTVIRGSPCDDMTADAIRKNTAVLEYERFAANGSAELLAQIARMNAEIEQIHEKHFNELAGIKSAMMELHREHGQHAETLGRVELQGADLVEEARRLKQGKRDAEARPMEAAREVVETMLDGLDPQQSVLFLAMRQAKGNRTHAARELGLAQGTVSKALPALRDAIRAARREVPEFLLPPEERKRLPDAPRKMAFGADGVEAADTRTPFDEVAEKDESEGGAE